MAQALIIDDSRAMRSLLKRMVTELGFEPLEAEHGQAALEALEANGPVTIALVDWNMPVMNGLEFVRTARDNRAYDRMRILMVTSEASPRNVYEAMKAGADEYAMKPVTADVLADKMCLLGVQTPAEVTSGAS